jgi:mono/diheme cytochrome c family protein
MAATDQTYRNQKTLDVVFAVSSILMLVSMVWMFIQDYNREWKTEQRVFRDVETAVFTRQAIADLPDPAKYDTAKKALEAAREGRKEKVKIKLREGDNVTEKEVTREEGIQELDAEIRRLKPSKERAEARVGDIKSLISSRMSFYDIARDHGLNKEAETYQKEVETYEKQLATAQADLDRVMEQIKDYQRERDALDRPLTRAETELKLATDELVRRARAATKKKWGVDDWLLSLPIIDAFGSPTKIHQFTLNDLTIDYNFKGVTRFDRCMTCHRGIDRAPFARERLEALREQPPSELEDKLTRTADILKELRSAFAGKPEEKNIPTPENVRALWDSYKTLPGDRLTDDRVVEFAAHPRLDLFVGSNSKHPAEKFGCTICHSGQGSATDFYWSSHTPNSTAQAHEWKKKHDWGAVHDWDFPMFPRRFMESGCLKCHHQVTDLITSYNRHEAPRLLRGYNLIREYGCFGCHEIQGTKDGRPIGPDLRLEPYPAPELLPAADRVRILGDKDNPPGTLRKVGPSLFRLTEKTNEEWTRKWIMSPRSFRPDTKMPHFYGLSNNRPDVLPEEQKNFPNAEVASIAHFLFVESERYLQTVKKVIALKKKLTEEGKEPRAHYEQVIRELEAKVADKAAFAKLTFAEQDRLKADLDQAKVEIVALEAAPPIHEHKQAAPKDTKAALANGRKLFSERGCLACHNHQATMTEKDGLPALPSDAHFGPTLSQITAKLGTKASDKESARSWLVHWITNPWLHSPRTKMPITHLDESEAAAVAEWLLSQEAAELGPDWAKLQVAPPAYNDLKDLAKVYLVRIVTRREMDEFFKPEAFKKGGPLADRVRDLPVDERALAERLEKAQNEKEQRAQTMWYLGRKAVSRLGCYGCHDIPGFENAKPIGTGLNEWGKKDPGRLAFEDIMNYLGSHHTRVEDWKDRAKVAEAFKEGAQENKTPYEAFFWDALSHATREGYLYQKIKEPRSYDYRRIKPWDDRSRMPQFKFSHSRKRGKENAVAFAARKAWQKTLGTDPGKARPAETENEFRARAAQEEAEAREAVMTFVLGLTGETIPGPYRNRPAQDRLAEVKGRQVLDKFNCAGCHNVRPGAFEFRATPETGTLAMLEARRKQVEATPSFTNDYNFVNHAIWQGRPPTDPAVLVARGVKPMVRPVTAKKVPGFSVLLTEGLAYRDAKGKMQNIRGGYEVFVPPGDVVIPPEALATPETFRDYLEEQGPHGGTFAELLARYLIEWGQREQQAGRLDQNPYADKEGKDNGRGYASGPPPLFNQGERTQPDWLFRFLRDPTRVRKLTVLRMPRFNMSDEEARALVHYFAAVERINNPGLGLEFPQFDIPQQAPLTDPFWRERSAEYVERLKQTADPTDPKQKLAKRVEEDLAPVWKQLVRENERLARDAEQSLKEAEKAVEKAKADLKNAKEGDKKSLETALADAQRRVELWTVERTRLQQVVKEATADALRKDWRATEAYAHAGYRALTKMVCSSCHEVGPLTPDPKQLQGPSLNLSHARLRPEWLKRWIANPQRYLPYESSMPQNLPNTPDQPQFQEFIAGRPLEQVLGIRDALMNLPAISAQPLNRLWLFPGANGEKTGDKK